MTLVLTKQSANPEFVKKLKIEDANMTTHIPTELHKITLHLRRQKLAQQWKKEGRGQGLEDDDVAMEAWVQEQLEQGGASEIDVRVSKKKSRNPTVVARIDNQNDDYEVQVQTRLQEAKKGHGDRVVFDNRMGTVTKVMRDGRCQVKWDKKQADGEEETTMQMNDLVLTTKAHPAQAVLASPPRRRSLRTGDPAWRYKSAAISSLSCLFSDPEANVPEFLIPSAEDSRRSQVARTQQDRRSKMMHNSASRSVTEPSVPRARKLDVQSKFREKPPFAQPGAQEMQISKEDGKPLGLIFDPETLCLLEAQKDTPAEAFDKFRGMRITHVSTRDDPQFSNDEGVHSAAQLRKALGRAQESQDVAVRFETWTQRRAVEKKKREFREKLISHRDKAMKDRATRD
eukprot:TRINITY_DN14087_c0_g1_i1.p1 TRINITY_DN14087_c0_g1~~TRINITY_DN14087_c0_g1_i1.p1  ORF type:complete len:399 (+),score=188.23 TRINITY_DN14087_c0_g1_i1:162-1358(+)